MIERDTSQAVTDPASMHSGPAAVSLSAPAIRVGLLSESALFRSGLRRLLAAERSFVVTEIKAPPIRESLRRSASQILLADAHIAGALEICRDLRLNGGRPWVILAGADASDRWAVGP